MRRLVLSALALSLFAPTGCGGTSTLTTTNDGARSTEGGERAPLAIVQCGANEVAVGGACAVIEGTTWELTTHMPEGTRVFLVDFHPGGRCTSHDPADSTTENDEWAVESKGLRFWFNERYVVYEVELDDVRTMHGITHNVNDLSWSWSARRVP